MLTDPSIDVHQMLDRLGGTNHMTVKLSTRTSGFHEAPQTMTFLISEQAVYQPSGCLIDPNSRLSHHLLSFSGVAPRDT